MTIFNERPNEERDNDFDDRMGTAFNALTDFFTSVDLAFPPDEKCTHLTRMRIYADAMKKCRVKMEQSTERKLSKEEKIFLAKRTFTD